MILKKITYTNPFTDQEVTEDHYFHISKADLVKMELQASDQVYTAKETGEELTGFRAQMQRIVDSEDGRAVMEVLEEFIRRSYGIKDGDRFRKSEQIWEDFASSEAYSQLFFELTTDADKGAEFINGIIPKNLDQIAAEVQAAAEKQKMAEALQTQEPTVEPATGTTQPADPLPPEPSTDDAPDTDRAKQLAQATAENPVLLATNEVQAMDSNELQSGLATGRYKLS